MWAPPESWTRLPGPGPASSGLWRVPGNPPHVVKRLVRPGPGDDPSMLDPGGLAWWRREADVAESGVLAQARGLVPPPLLAVEEDAEGVSVHWAERASTPVDPLDVARALARFSLDKVGGTPWMLRDQFVRRLAAVERRGGWSRLARTPAADLADALWVRRTAVVERLGRSAQGLAHGDLTPGNVLAPGPGGSVVTVDWACFGSAPLGHDLGYLSLSVRVPLEELVAAYLDAIDVGTLRPEPADVLHAARATAAFTALTRADWALSRVEAGEGALAGKVRHPAVAAHLRLLEKQERSITTLLGLR